MEYMNFAKDGDWSKEPNCVVTKQVKRNSAQVPVGLAPKANKHNTENYMDYKLGYFN